jgi:isopentenyl-diphosphate delta-isomerase type 1
MDQTLILVDNDNTTLGYAPRHVCHAGDGRLHRAVAVVLVDRTGRILLQHRRSPLWDGYWDLTAATHPLLHNDREETCLEAAHRCLASEWSIQTQLHERFAFTYFERHGDSSENEYCVIFVGGYDRPVSPNREWAYGFRWLTLEACLEHLQESTAYTPWAQIALGRMAALGPKAF